MRSNKRNGSDKSNVVEKDVEEKVVYATTDQYRRMRNVAIEKKGWDNFRLGIELEKTFGRTRLTVSDAEEYIKKLST